MYPIYRLFTGILKAKKSTPLKFTDVSVIHFRCRAWDLDMFMEMNNGRVLTLFDLGRFDLALRTGLSAVLKKEKWGLVVAGSSIRYRKRVRFWDKVEMRTQVKDVDERWIYIEQSMWVNGEACSAVLLRTGITSKGKVIDPQLLQDTMGVKDVSFAKDTFIEAWKKSELDRPWPPLK